MKIAIMQPYFLPYIGYWQLINAVDEFVIYDNIKYTKKGWINRNRYVGGRTFTIPIKKGSDSLTVVEREISEVYDRKKLSRQIQSAYRDAVYLKQCFPLVNSCIMDHRNNLFEYIHRSVINICDYLNVNTKITVSSNINIDHSLKSQEKVLAICKAMNATQYINPIGGTELYDKAVFQKEGISLNFLKTKSENTLSIVDILMRNPTENMEKILGEFRLV